MGVGPLQQPFLEGGGAHDAGTPSAPPLAPQQQHAHPAQFGPPAGLVQRGDTPYTAAFAPPPAAGYPPAMEQQQRGVTGAYAPPVIHAPGAAPQLQPPPLLAHPHLQQQPSFGPTHVVETSTVIYERPVVQRMGGAPVLQICPACGRTGPTRVRRERGYCTWLQCFGMCWLFCPLFWLPCCLDCSKDLVHRCGHCGAEVARVQPCT